MLNETHWDRFDIVEAYYLALTDCHGGQYSKSYARLCKLTKIFRPSPLLNINSLTENGLAIYVNACYAILSGEDYVD